MHEEPNIISILSHCPSVASALGFPLLLAFSFLLEGCLWFGSWRHCGGRKRLFSEGQVSGVDGEINADSGVERWGRPLTFREEKLEFWQPLKLS